MSPADPSSVSELAREAEFVFRGIVTKPGAATLRMVKELDRVAVVGIERVFRAPGFLGLDRGREVTVYSERPEALKRGARGVFFCTAWLYGEGIALRELAHLDVPPADDDALGKRLAEIEREDHDRDLVKRGGSAPIVIAATIAEVGEVVGGGGQPLLEEMADDDPPPPGGDDTVARRIELVVDEVVRGDEQRSKLVVDVWVTGDPRWAEPPQLRKGARGLWFLRGGKRRLRGGPLLLTDRDDYRPLADLSTLRRLEGGDR